MYLENQTDSFNQTSFLQKDKFLVFVVSSLASSYSQGARQAQTDIYSAAKKGMQEIQNSITRGPREDSVSQCIPWLNSSLCWVEKLKTSILLRPSLHLKVACIIKSNKGVRKKGQDLHGLCGITTYLWKSPGHQRGTGGSRQPAFQKHWNVKYTKKRSSLKALQPNYNLATFGNWGNFWLKGRNDIFLKLCLTRGNLTMQTVPEVKSKHPWGFGGKFWNNV